MVPSNKEWLVLVGPCPGLPRSLRTQQLLFFLALLGAGIFGMVSRRSHGYDPQGCLPLSSAQQEAAGPLSKSWDPVISPLPSPITF